jgi:hypothetical protein
MVNTEKPDTVGVVVDEVKALLVEQGSKVSLSYSQPNSICKPLTKGASGNLDACTCIVGWVRSYMGSKTYHQCVQPRDDRAS